MLFIKKITKYIGYSILSIFIYLLFSIIISLFTVNNKQEDLLNSKDIYLDTNGVHLSIIIPIGLLSKELKQDLKIDSFKKFIMFGWGDENFYLNTPTWNEFKFKYAFGALFLNNPTAIHIKSFYRKKKDWVSVKANDKQLYKLNDFIQQTFLLDSLNRKIIIPQNIYGKHNTFYKAKGSYSPTKTCNTWANEAFKESGLKACYWTLFDFGLLNKYQ